MEKERTRKKEKREKNKTVITKASRHLGPFCKSNFTKKATQIAYRPHTRWSQQMTTGVYSCKILKSGYIFDFINRLFMKFRPQLPWAAGHDPHVSLTV
jgi:hypothetical protein